MTILLLLIPISLLLLGVAIWAFIWAVRRGQFEDLDSAALDILVDESALATPAEDRAAASTTTPSPSAAPSPLDVPSPSAASDAPVSSATPSADATAPADTQDTDRHAN